MKAVLFILKYLFFFFKLFSFSSNKILYILLQSRFHFAQGILVKQLTSYSMKSCLLKALTIWTPRERKCGWKRELNSPLQWLSTQRKTTIWWDMWKLSWSLCMPHTAKVILFSYTSQRKEDKFDILVLKNTLVFANNNWLLMIYSNKKCLKWDWWPSGLVF